MLKGCQSTMPKLGRAAFSHGGPVVGSFGQLLGKLLPRLTRPSSRERVLTVCSSQRRAFGAAALRERLQARRNTHVVREFAGQVLQARACSSRRCAREGVGRTFSMYEFVCFFLRTSTCDAAVCTLPVMGPYRARARASCSRACNPLSDGAVGLHCLQRCAARCQRRRALSRRRFVRKQRVA
eukprot:6060154-Lingulodinium_polyedra.AAC.1